MVNEVVRLDGTVQGVSTEANALDKALRKQTFERQAEDILINAEYFVFYFRMMLKHYRSVLFCVMNC